MAIAVGDKIPQVSFMYMGAEGPTKLSSKELCGGKKVALFGLPGAFTPVCSAQHLPGFVDKADEILDKGIDTIACVSVNDPFVMEAWGQAHHVDDKVMMLADCDGAFARGTGLAVDLSDFGLGERSERFSMIIEDGVVKSINVEDSILSHDLTSAEKLAAQA